MAVLFTMEKQQLQTRIVLGSFTDSTAYLSLSGQIIFQAPNHLELVSLSKMSPLLHCIPSNISVYPQCFSLRQVGIFAVLILLTWPLLITISTSMHAD